jgi:ribosomal subunit interface protein
MLSAHKPNPKRNIMNDANEVIQESAPNHAPSIVIQGVGFPITDAIETHLRSSSERLFRHSGTIESIHYYLNRAEGAGVEDAFSVKARLAVPGPDFAVEVQHPNLYHAITELSHKLDRQLRRRARKQRSLKNKRMVRQEVILKP